MMLFIITFEFELYSRPHRVGTTRLPRSIPTLDDRDAREQVTTIRPHRRWSPAWERLGSVRPPARPAVRRGFFPSLCPSLKSIASVQGAISQARYVGLLAWHRPLAGSAFEELTPGRAPRSSQRISVRVNPRLRSKA